MTWVAAHAEDTGVKLELKKQEHSLMAPQLGFHRHGVLASCVSARRYQPDPIGPQCSAPWASRDGQALMCRQSWMPTTGRVTQALPASLPCSCCPEPGGMTSPNIAGASPADGEHGCAQPRWLSHARGVRAHDAGTGPPFAEGVTAAGVIPTCLPGLCAQVWGHQAMRDARAPCASSWGGLAATLPRQRVWLVWLWSERVI